jgi:deaminated glutathione amidase
MAQIRVAAVQLQSQDNILANLARCEHWISVAAANGAQLVVLPENFAYFGNEAGRRAAAELLGDYGKPIQGALSKAATVQGVAILAGGWPELNSNAAQPYNSATLFTSSGNYSANYRKIHLFDVTLPNGQVIRESDAVAAGSQVVVCDFLGFRLGLSICYDLRFPELYRQLVRRGCEIICIPSAFTEDTGRAHWELLVRSRAIESQSWVIAANQSGQHPGNRHTFGHTMIVDAWGSICAVAPAGEGIVFADISTESIVKVRTSMPCLRHRRHHW